MEYFALRLLHLNYDILNALNGQLKKEYKEPDRNEMFCAYTDIRQKKVPISNIGPYTPIFRTDPSNDL